MLRLDAAEKGCLAIGSRARACRFDRRQPVATTDSLTPAIRFFNKVQNSA